MLAKKQVSFFLKSMILRSLKLPIIYLLIGIILITLAYTDDIFPLTQTKWKHLFDFTDKAGTLFIAIAAITFLYRFIDLACRWYEKKISTTKQMAALILSSLRKGLRIIFILTLINISIYILGPQKLYVILANNIINCIIIGSCGWIAVQILYTVEAFLYQRMMMKLSHPDHLRMKGLYTKMQIIRNSATVVIIILTIAAMLMSFSSVRNIGISLLASAGFLTAIVGLAAQKTLFSIFTGLQLALSQQIKIGDIVLIENTSGTIEEITFTHVTLKISDKRRLIVPIQFFVEKPFENWSRDNDGLCMSLLLYVDYMMPIAPIRTELEKILQHSPLWDGKTKALQVSNLTKKTVELRIQISAATADNLSELAALVREKILSFIREEYKDYFSKVRLIDRREQLDDMFNWHSGS